MIPSPYIDKELTTRDGSVPRSLIGTAFRFVLVAAALSGLVFLATWDKGRYYPLFHSIADMATVFVAGSVFLVVWNGRRHLDNDYYLFVAIAFLAFALLDFMHIIGNKGMGVFTEYGNLGPTFYIASRYVLGISFLLAPLFIKRKVSTTPVFLAYLLVVVLVLLSVLHWRNFPATYIEGTGLTAFKVYSDYAVCLMLLGGLGLLLLNRRAFDTRILKIISLSLIFSIATGLSFTLYNDPFGIMNAAGHFFQIASFYLIYLGFVETALTKPQNILYRNLKQSNDNILKLNSELADLNLSLLNDIAARKRVEEALRQSEDRFLLAASAAHTMVYEIDLVTQRVKAMQGLSHLLGYEVSESEMSLEWWDSQILPEDLPKCHAAFRTMHDNPRDHVLEYRVRHRDGRVLWVEDHATPVLTGGRVEGIVGTVIDITARKQAEEELLAANAELTATANELARSNKELEQFANIASHDLQEPLRTVKAFLDLLVMRLAGKLDDKEKQYLGFVTDGASRMQHLIADLLRYSRSGSKGLAIADISLRDCAAAAVTALGSSIQEAAATVHLGDLPMVKADATWITQVLQNLIANAIKFCRKDVSPEVSISVSRHDGEILVSVKDNGIGIPADQCEHVFEMFKRLHSRGEYSGTGIGLAICRKVIERHGGRIWVESKPGRGSTFFFTLPAGEASEEPQGGAAQRRAVSPSVQPEVLRVLQAARDAHDALRESEERFRSLFEQTPDAVFLTTPDTGKVHNANPAACGMFGMTVQELCSTGRGIIAPEDGRLSPALEERKRTGQARAELTCVRKNGQRFPAELTSVIVPGNPSRAFVIVRDITARKKAEAALAAVHSRLQSIINNTPALVYILDLDERFVLVNNALAELLHTTPEQMLGKRRHEFMPQQDADWHEANDRQAIAAGQPVEFEESSQLDGRSIAWLTTKFPLCDAHGKIYAVAGITTDITERKRAEEALHQAVVELEQSNEELEQFAYVASHDLQEPLRQVRAFSQMLKDRHADKLDGKAAEYLGFVYDGAARMSELVRGLLAYSRVGSREARHEPTGCQQALDAALANLRVILAETGAIITHDELPTVSAEPTQLAQLFQNLIGNAVHYRRDGVAPEIHVGVRKVSGDKVSGVSVQVSGKRAEEVSGKSSVPDTRHLKPETCSSPLPPDTRHLTPENSFYLFSVRDNGIGIAEEFHEKVFEIFKRLHGQEKPGTGIGLAISKKIVEHHGGKIWIESKPLEGSTFYFTIPEEKV